MIIYLISSAVVILFAWIVVMFLCECDPKDSLSEQWTDFHEGISREGLWTPMVWTTLFSSVVLPILLLVGIIIGIVYLIFLFLWALRSAIFHKPKNEK